MFAELWWTLSGLLCEPFLDDALSTVRIRLMKLRSVRIRWFKSTESKLNVATIVRPPLMRESGTDSGPTGNRTRIACLQGRHPPIERQARRCSPPSNTRRPVIPDGVEPPSPGCKPGVVSVGRRDRFEELRVMSGELLASHSCSPPPNDQGGSRTHKHQALDLTALPSLRTWPSLRREVGR